MSNAPPSNKATAPAPKAAQKKGGGRAAATEAEGPGLVERVFGMVGALMRDVIPSKRFLTNDLLWMRVPLTWFLVGLAIVVENFFNRRAGVGPAYYLRGTSVDLGIVAIFIGGLFLLAERRRDATLRSGAPSLLYRAGLAILVASSVAHTSHAVDGWFSFGALGAFSIFDVGIALGGTLALLAAHRGLNRSDLPGERLIALVSTLLFAIGLAATFVDSVGARDGFSLRAAAAYIDANDASTIVLPLLGLHPGAAAPLLEHTAGTAAVAMLDAVRQPPTDVGFSLGVLFVLLGVVGCAVHCWRAHRINTPALHTGCSNTDVWIVAIAGIIFYSTTITTFGLLDPWEGHYSEVARQMVVRGDWISQFWESEWFWSKPVGTFWIEALSFSLFGVSDFALRFPHILLGVFGIVVVYLFCRELLNRRTAVMSAIVLATMPHWFFISRQGLTDMPFVALITAGLGFFGLAMFRHKEGDAESPRLTWLVYPLLFLTTLPQYSMISEELEMFGGYHAIAYLVVFVPLAIFVTTRRDPRSAYLYAFYMCCGLATLAKGLLGFALPGAILLAYLLVTFEWRIIIEARIPVGIVIVLLTALPWHLAMWARHGIDWWREYFEQHHLNRLSAGVHQTDAGTSFDYFVKWGAYGAFPWIAFLPIAASRFWKSLAPDSRERRAKVLVGAWIAVTFTIFTISATKFHHYILPAMPPLAIAIGYGLSEFWNDRLASRLPLLVAACLLVIVGYDFLRDPNHLINLFIYKYHRPWPWGITPERTIAPLLALGAAILAMGFFPDRPNIRPKVLLGTVGLLIGAGIAALVTSSIWPQSTFRVLIAAAAAGGFGARFGVKLAGTDAQLKWMAAAAALLAVGICGGYWTISNAVRKSAIPMQTLAMDVPDEPRANQLALVYSQAFDHALPIPGGTIMNRFVADLRNITGELAKNGCADPQGRPVQPLIGDLCNQLKYERAAPLFKIAPGLAIFIGLALVVGLVFIPGAQRRVIVAFMGFAIIWAGWGMYDYMVQLAPHWTQREFFSTLHNLRSDRRELPAPLAAAAIAAVQSPFAGAIAAPFSASVLIPELLDEDALAAYQMNWRTETWYSRNEVDPIHKAGADRRLMNFAKTPGRRFVLIEKETISDQRLRQEIARGGINRPMRDWQQTSNKYSMWSIE